jgi:hypothetical protein
MMIQIVGDSPEARAGRAEISLLTWKAQRYDKLTQAMVVLSDLWAVFCTDSICYEVENMAGGNNCFPHDRTPDGIADAIIRAAAQPAPAPAAPSEGGEA